MAVDARAPVLDDGDKAAEPPKVPSLAEARRIAEAHSLPIPEVAGRALTPQQSERPEAGTQPRTGATAHCST